jgi:hypothetical protein
MSNQGPADAFKHSQTGAFVGVISIGRYSIPYPMFQDSGAARAEAQNFINDNLNRAVLAQLDYEASSGRNASEDPESDKAMWYFGQALHTVTDASSPWHNDFQTSWGPGNPLGSLGHVIGEYLGAPFHMGKEEEAVYSGMVLWSQYQNQLQQAREKEHHTNCAHMVGCRSGN